MKLWDNIQILGEQYLCLQQGWQEAGSIACDGSGA